MFQVRDFLAKKSIHRDTEMYAEAQARKEKGQIELAVFVVSHSTKSLNDLIDNTWKMQKAKAATEREKKIRMDMVKKCPDGSCIELCEGK